MKRYLILDGSGKLESVASSKGEARDMASFEASRTGGQAFDTTPDHEEQQNPYGGPGAVTSGEDALDRMVIGMGPEAQATWNPSGVGTHVGLFPRELVMSMSVNEAIARLYAFQQLTTQVSQDRTKPGQFRGSGFLASEAKGVAEALWFKPDGWFLKSNAKIAKGSKFADKIGQAVGFGLALTPERTVAAGHSAAGQHFPKLPTLASVGIDVPYAGGQVRAPAHGLFTLCAGASAECEKSCLVVSGQNVGGGIYNNTTKYMRTLAFLMEPVAFLRGLVASIESYKLDRTVTVDKTKLQIDRRTMRYLRLNVFSDVPWELVCPWLITDFTKEGKKGTLDRLKFYDYTKVPNRNFARELGYDLSFSFSGSNWGSVGSELQQGRRAVVVFVAPQWETGQQRKRSGKAIGKLPTVISSPELLGGAEIPVVDGDLTDFRPLDVEQCIVGLRWKFPQLKNSGARKYPELRDQLVANKTRFVVRGDVVQSDAGEVFALAEAHGTSGASSPIEGVPGTSKPYRAGIGHKFTKSR